MLEDAATKQCAGLLGGLARSQAVPKKKPDEQFTGPFLFHVIDTI
jgi:hypothetical protein